MEKVNQKVNAVLTDEQKKEFENMNKARQNRHHTMEAYIEAKEAIARNQTGKDICVLNYDNEYTRAFGEVCPATPVYFSSHQVLKDGYTEQGTGISGGKTDSGHRQWTDGPSGGAAVKGSRRNR